MSKTKHDVHKWLNKNHVVVDLVIATVLLLLGILLLWDVLLKFIKILLGIFLVLVAFYFYGRSKGMYRVRFFKF